MRLIPSDPDVETVISRIKRGDIELQPDFQRGEVWSENKKRRLVDSILRAWHVPPIHVVEVDGGVPEVLDGQQRLVAIRDFAMGKITVDGRIEPKDEDIAKLDGLRYEELPPAWRRRFDAFSIRFFNIVDYAPDEPAELFFRLNQPVALTSPEQRNAFFGAARSQVKELAAVFSDYKVGADVLGFSNSRMAYEDVIARFCSHLEAGTLKTKVTAATLADRYRSKHGFTEKVFAAAHDTLATFAVAVREVARPVRFNKATLFSWLWFTATARAVGADQLPPDTLGGFLEFFEARRTARKGSSESMRATSAMELPGRLRDVLALYEDRASSRVLDITSLLARDAAIWILGVEFEEQARQLLVPNGAREMLRRMAELGEGQPLVETLVSGGWSDV